MKKRIIAYAKLMRLHRPIGILLLLWPTLWALWLAHHGIPTLKILIVFVLGVVVMRSAGCVINDYADRKIDGFVARTKVRPLITGEVTTRGALILFFCLCVIALILVLQLNIFTIKLSVIGLCLATIYPFMKRYTHLPQVFLGAAYGWAIPMAFAAQTNTIPDYAWLLFITSLLWSVAYDTMYAMVDRDDDQKIGVKSTAVLFGNHDWLYIGIIQMVIILLLVYVGWLLKLSIIYFCSLLAGLGLFVYQQYLIRDRQAPKCFQAFLNNNWFGFVVFLGILLSIF